MPVTLNIYDETFAGIDRELSRLALIGTDRAKAVRRGGVRAGGIVKTRVQETLPKPGYPGDRSHDKDGFKLKPLRDTVEVRFKDYGNGIFVVIVGYGYPAGSHGHLAEAGHQMVAGGRIRKGYRDTVDPSKRQRAFAPREQRVADSAFTGRVVGFVEGRWDIRDAAAATEAEQNEALISGVLDFIAETQRG